MPTKKTKYFFAEQLFETHFPLSKVSFSPNYEKSSKEEFFVFENHLWHHHHLVIVSTAFWPKKIHNDAYSTFYKTLCLCVKLDDFFLENDLIDWTRNFLKLSHVLLNAKMVVVLKLHLFRFWLIMRVKVNILFAQNYVYRIRLTFITQINTFTINEQNKLILKMENSFLIMN